MSDPTPLDRALKSFRALVRAEDPNRTLFGLWEYSVTTADATKFSGYPTSQDFPLPPLVDIPWRASLAGSSCVPVKGTLAYVAFANADPSKPIVIHFGPTVPETVTIDATDTIELGASATTVNVNTDLAVSGSASVDGSETVAGTLQVGGGAAVPVSLSTYTDADFAAVSTTLGLIAGAFNAVMPGMPVLAVNIPATVIIPTASVKTTSV